MSVYSALSNGEIDAESPWTSAVTFKMRDNPLSIMEGDPTALTAGKGIHVDKGGQTAIITDETDTGLVLVPDGAGSAEWIRASGSIAAVTIPLDLTPSLDTLSIPIDLTDASYFFRSACSIEFDGVFTTEGVIVNGTITFQTTTLSGSDDVGVIKTSISGSNLVVATGNANKFFSAAIYLTGAS